MQWAIGTGQMHAGWLVITPSDFWEATLAVAPLRLFLMSYASGAPTDGSEI